MANLKDTGFILRRIPYSESSLILKAYTREHGLMSFMAKGAKRQNSRLHGLLEPVIHLQFLFPAASRGEIKILSDVALLHDFPAVRDDLVKQSLAQAFGEVLLKYMPDEARAPDFHDLLLAATERLEAAPATRRAVEAVVAGYLLDFCRLSGYQPQFRFCVRCDARVAGAGVTFAVDRGGPVCARCRDAASEGGDSQTLREATLRWLDFALNGDPDAAEEADETITRAPLDPPEALYPGRTEAARAEEFLLLYLGRHAGGQKPLKSVGVWRALME